MPGKRDITYFGPFAFDPRRQELTKRGHRIRMPASQLRLLNLFLERPGELITRDEITAALWVDTGNIDIATGINTAIKRLRQSLSDFKDAPEYIETVIGVGYRFVAELQEAPSQPKPTQGLSAKVPPPHASTSGEMAASEAGFVALDAMEPLSLSSSTLPGAGRSGTEVRLLAYGPAAAFALGCLLVLGGAGSVLLYRLRLVHSVPRASSAQPAASSRPALSTWDGQLDRITTAAMSPDGRGIAYSNRDGVSLHGFNRGEQLLTSLPPIQTEHISWFPDGKQFLLTGTNDRTQRREVWAVPTEGWLPTLILQDADHAVVSPDGGSIAYTREHGSQIWIAGAAGKNPRRLTTDASVHVACIVWAASGDHLLVGYRTGAEPLSSGSTSNADVSYKSIDATNGVVLDRETDVPFVSGYALPDGRLYYPVEVATKPFERSTQLMLVQTDPRTGRFLGRPQPSQHLEGSVTSLSASLDGKKLAFLLDRPVVGLMVADLHLPGPVLENVHQVPSSAKESYPHAWTPDGSAVLLERELVRGYAIYQQPLDGVGPTLVSNLPDSVAMAQVTPDGRWILFMRFVGKPQEAIGIFRVPASGGNAQQVPTTGSLDNFRCSMGRNGRCVVREAIGNTAMAYFQLDPVKGMGRELTRTPWEPRILGDWDISPDGKTAVVADHDEDKPRIQLVDLESSPAKITYLPVPGHGIVYEAIWAADGASLFVETRTTVGFELLHVDLAGRVRLLRKSPTSIWAVPSRDGKKLAFPGLSTSRNVWTLAVSP